MQPKLTFLPALGFAVLLSFVPACNQAKPASSESSPEESPEKLDMDFDTTSWKRALDRYAREGGLDYAGLASDRTDLDTFLIALEVATPAAWGAAEQMAFWSNAYNAVVADFVLELYPDIESVKSVEGFFNRKTRLVAGEQLTLDEIEGRARDLGDPRVHFAVVCASTSCPDLLEEPFEGARLDQQLEQQTARFLSDPAKGMRYDAEQDILWLSSIFKWYAGDFTGGSTVVAYFARGKLAQWLEPHLPRAVADSLAGKDPSIKYLDYDWSLNDR